MNYMDWAAMGAASSAYAEASRARSENQDLWHQNQMLSNELARLQDQMDQHQDSLDALKNDIARRKAMEEFQGLGAKLAINHTELSILTIIFFFKVAVIFIALKAGRFP